MSTTKQSELPWNDDTLRVTDDGHVEGQAWYGSFAGGYDVTATVVSYNFEQYGETKTNHVPHVVVTDERGSIVAEPHAYDSRNPETSIERAKSTAQSVAEEPERYID